MKTKILIIILSASTFFISCKNESQKSEKTDIEEVLKDFFIITLDVKVKNSDDFQVYYTESEGEIFSEEKSVWVNVKGSENQQKIAFNLPKDVVPHLIRLDFGLSNFQDDIILYSVQLDYFDKEFLITKDMLPIYFRALETTQIDFTTGTIKSIIKDGKRQEPVLYPHEAVLGPEIEKLTK